jgi:hypothetical protein
MSYKNIKKVQGKYAMKKAAKEVVAASEKRSCGRKCKSSASAVRVKTKRIRKSEIEAVENEIAAAGLGDHYFIL